MDEPKTALVVFDYSDRKNGWYAQRLDAEGNQIGAAEYCYRKDDVLQVATDWAVEHGVKVQRARRT